MGRSRRLKYLKIVKFLYLVFYVLNKKIKMSFILKNRFIESKKQILQNLSILHVKHFNHNSLSSYQMNIQDWGPFLTKWKTHKNNKFGYFLNCQIEERKMMKGLLWFFCLFRSKCNLSQLWHIGLFSCMYAWSKKAA